MIRRARTTIIASIASGVLLGPLACTDLFHSTDFPTLCELSDAAPACHPDASIAPSTGPLCAPDSASTIKIARSTCAKLSACSAITGRWNVATCIDDGALAYGCADNAQMAPRGARSEFWRCVRYAADCAGIRQCILGSPVLPSCSASAKDYASCAAPGVRVLCGAAGGQPVAIESCFAQGRTCVDGRCGGGASACTESGCDGAALHACVADGAGTVSDVGYDCTLSGDGKCRGAGVASFCAPSGGASCTNTTVVKCENGVAIACTAGAEQRVNCTSLGLPCVGGELTAEGAVSACKGDTDCPVDTCGGTSVQSCARRLGRSLDCAAEGYGPCVVQTIAGDVLARCTAKR